MSLPLPDLTFYKMADVSVATANFSGIMSAIYSSLTGTTDYRGTALPSTHLWTWATASTPFGTGTTAVYNTAIPTSSGANKFAILFANTSSATSISPLSYSMASPDTDVTNTTKVQIVRNPGAWNDWIGPTPFTTTGSGYGNDSGYAPGFWRIASNAANVTTTLIRTYISEEAVFVRVIQNATTQYWTYVGAIFEPHTTYASNSYTAESDDRILGLLVNGSTANGAGFLSTNAASSFGFHGASAGNAHGGAIRPGVPKLDSVTRTTTVAAVASGGDKDLAGNYVLEKPCYYSTVSTAWRVGSARSFYHLGLHTANTTVIRSGSTDLYHVISYNTASSQAIALKAAP